MLVQIKPLLVKISPDELLLLQVDYKATCWWRASPTQPVGDLASPILVMTRGSPHTLGCVGRTMHPSSPGDGASYQAPLLSTVHIRTGTQHGPSWYMALPRRAPFLLVTYTPLHHTCNAANLPHRRGGWAFVTSRIWSVDWTAWISTKAGMFFI